jgi:hypothetical protein
MLSEILVPDEQHHSIELPKELYGKKVQVIAYEIADTAVAGKDKKLSSFWDDIDFNPNFPSIEEIRKTAWPLK